MPSSAPAHEPRAHEPPTLRRLAAIFRMVPQRFPGKARVARRLLQPYFDRRDLVIALQHYSLVVPSLEEPIALHSLIDGAYEPELVSLLQRELQPGDVVVDVGANIGAIALEAAAQVGDTGRVIAIEASPTIQPYLAQNIERNGARNITIFRCAAHESEEQTLDFYEAPVGKFGMGAVAPQFNTRPTSVRCRTLDSITGEAGVAEVRLVKMDVEGAEASVLRGAKRLLESPNAPVIVFEFSDWAEARMPNTTIGDAQRELLKAGFTIWTLDAYLAGHAPLSEVLTSGYTTLVAKKAARDSALSR